MKAENRSLLIQHLGRLEVATRGLWLPKEKVNYDQIISSAEEIIKVAKEMKKGKGK